VSDSAAPLPNNDCDAGACLPGVPDGLFDVLVNSGGVQCLRIS